MNVNKNTYDRRVDTIENIVRIDFSIHTNKDILDDSAISEPNGIMVAELYNNGEPVAGGVNDRRLGALDRSECATCGEMALKCPGHFGHIKLVEPVFHIGFLPLLRNVMSCVCFRCHKLLVYKNEAEIARLLRNKSGKQRFAEVRNVCKGITHCQKENSGCGTPVHKITIDKKYGSVLLLAEPVKQAGDAEEGETKKRVPRTLTPQLCYDVLRAVSDEDCIIMGFDPSKSRPRDMILINFPVAPVQMRPSVKLEIASASISYDDLTLKIAEIVKSNENLRNAKGDGSLIKTGSVHDDYMLLQIHVATFFNNDSIGLLRSQLKNKKVHKALVERLKGKNGRVRGNLMGKRVDMSGRTVITTDPYISINAVGVPLKIVSNLTYPEIVSKHNIDYLRQIVKNGTKIYPGANNVIKNIVGPDGAETRVDYLLKYTKNPIPLEIGDTVERHLKTDDIIMFNRQPSLHKLSMMGHNIDVIEDPELYTFRVNVNVTEPYNADFDGDEMNVHVPQSIQTVTELRLITNPALRFINPTTSKVAIPAKQDTLMGSYLQSYESTTIDWKDAMNILMTTSVGISGNLPKHKLYSGKYVYSQIIDPRINIVQKKDGGEYRLRILKGKLLDGLIAKSEISTILHKTWFTMGSKVTKNFLDDVQRMILQFLLHKGFSMGIEDVMVPHETNKAVAKTIETKRKEVLRMITEYENDPYVMTSEAFEVNLRETLRSTQGEIDKTIGAVLKPRNNIYIAVSAGSSGLPLNWGQIMGCVGQIMLVENTRITNKYGHRPLPTFHKHDNSAFARGFCAGSYIGGLNPMEFFYQVISSREGSINTQIKTSETGYVQRKLVKLLEDIKVEYDGTVRNANDKIIQCLYGDNGINTERQIEQKIYLMSSNNKAIQDNYVYDTKEIQDMIKNKTTTNYTEALNKQLYEKLVSMRDTMRKLQSRFATETVEFKESYMVPIDIQQQILNITVNLERNNKKVVDPFYVLKKVREMYTEFTCMKYRKDKSKIKIKDEERVKFLLKFYLYDTLSPKKCTHQHKLSQEEFDSIVEYFQKIMRLAKIEGGEMVGVIAAQSIGEPVTQSNLKSFHKSGSVLLLGLPRVKELLGVTRNPKVPVTRVVLEDKYKSNKVISNRIASYLKFTTLKDVADVVDIYYDPDPRGKKSIMTRDGVHEVFESSQGKSGCQAEIDSLPWIIRIQLSKEKMIERSVTMLDIKTSFCYNWATRYEDVRGSKKDIKKVIDKITQCSVITNNDNSDVPTVHIRFDANNYNFSTLVQFQDLVVTKFKIKGVTNITESNNVVEESYYTFDEEGNKVNKKHFVIIAEGINLQEITQINGIDLAQTVCNDIVAIYEMYGVEAARAAFIREFTIALGSSGGMSNYQHLSILADAITHTGGLISVNRHGANKLDTDPFSRASFEQTVEQLLAAAAFGESDHIRSVSARIMVGSLINGGTGSFDLLLDHEKVKNTLVQTKKSEEKTIKRKTAVSDLIRKKKATNA